MVKIKKLDNKTSSNGLRLTRLGEVLTLNNGDVIGIAQHMDNIESCNDLCYFSTNDGIMNFCKGTASLEKEVPNFELYARQTKFKNCFLRAGWHFVKVSSKKRGV